MKIAAIALASALAAAAFSGPSFAQSGNSNDRDQAGPMQYGPGGQNQFRGGMNRDRDGFGMRDNWRRDDNSRNADNDDFRGGWRRDDGMRGRMGMMGPHMHGRFGGDGGASFSFGNGRARMAVHCAANESVETCVRAASQLLDKITSLRTGTSAATPGSSSSTGSGTGDNSPALHPGTGNGSSGSSSSGSSGSSSTGDDE